MSSNMIGEFEPGTNVMILELGTEHSTRAKVMKLVSSLPPSPSSSALFTRALSKSALICSPVTYAATGHVWHRSTVLSHTLSHRQTTLGQSNSILSPGRSGLLPCRTARQRWPANSSSLAGLLEGRASHPLCSNLKCLTFQSYFLYVVRLSWGFAAHKAHRVLPCRPFLGS